MVAIRSFTRDNHDFFMQQHMFWVASASLSPDTRVNVSPKGLEGTFCFFPFNNGCLGNADNLQGVRDTSVNSVDKKAEDAVHSLFKRRYGTRFDPDETMCILAYLDLGGSGVETIAHCREPDNGRIVAMFSAFDGPPGIYRMWGLGTYIEPHELEWDDIVAYFPSKATSTWYAKNEDGKPAKLRNIILIQVKDFAKSCGFGVPLMEYKGDRDIYRERYDQRTLEELIQLRKNMNTVSIDNRPGLPLFDNEPVHRIKHYSKTTKTAILASTLAFTFLAGCGVGYFLAQKK